MIASEYFTFEGESYVKAATYDEVLYKLIAELQDQHQQDCIKINQLHVTIDTLVDKYSRLRKSVGMD